MENASKALIIAGAIILAVLIIGLGMMVFMQSNNVVDPGSEMDALARDQFNSKFTPYEGTMQGSRVMNLCDTVRQVNMQYRDDNTKQVLIEGGDKDTEDFTDANQYSGTATDDSGSEENVTKKLNSATTVKKAIRSGKTYNVTFQYDKNTGLICTIHVRDLAE